jgi:hypothetical protein
MHGSSILGRVVGFSLAALTLAAVPAGADVRAVVKVTAHVHARSVLRVSTQQLTWDLPVEGGSRTAVVDFTASARTARDAEIVLIVEPERWIVGPRGVAAADAHLTFSGLGSGMLAGRLNRASPAVAGRWTGSGQRAGQLAFELRAALAGRYHLPVRLVLTAP